MGQKIFTSADKIFALSWKDPIGIMIYGNAELMGLPWETIVKEYRRTAVKESLPTVDAHAREFLSFITNEKLFSQSLQDKQYTELVSGYYSMMRRQIRKLVEETLKETKQMSESKIASIVRKVINEHCLLWEEQSPLESLPKGFVSSVKKKHQEAIRGSIAEVFEKMPLSQNTQKKLVELAVRISSKWPPQQITPPTIAGLVIAGFGHSELFPMLRAFEVLTVIDGVAIHRRVDSKCIDIGADMGAAVVRLCTRRCCLDVHGRGCPILPSNDRNTDPRSCDESAWRNPG